ncbi:MAG: hypothetical protein AAF226_00065, partial [Verrucomicrobiota bacterium]
KGKQAFKAAIRKDNYKLVKFYDADPELIVTELYDLSSDLGETKNVRNKKGVARRLEELLDEYMDEVGGIRAAVPDESEKKKKKPAK